MDRHATIVYGRVACPYSFPQRLFDGFVGAAYRLYKNNVHIMFSAMLLASFLTFVELNCENLFDCRHDSLKDDTEYLPQSVRRWTPYRYWRKLDAIGRALVSCCDDSTGYGIPDIAVLCEVENDSVMRDLTRRSLLHNLNYDYLITNSSDSRGIDVAIMYHTFSFLPIRHWSLRVEPIKGMRPTRDILYVAGSTAQGDTLHIFAVHAPSRYGGERYSRPFRMAVAERLCKAVDSLRNVSPEAKIIVAGDFNAYDGERSLNFISAHGLTDITSGAIGRNGAKGTYSHEGWWRSLDHVFVSESLLPHFFSSFINDAPFLLEYDKRYGGKKPFRTYYGMRYQPGGTSDHLPLVVKFKTGD